MISHLLELIFIHIPKTAGTSLTVFLKDYLADEIEICKSKLGKGQGVKVYSELPEITTDIKHKSLQFYYDTYPEICQENQYCKMTIVRNPYDRIISYYCFLARIKKDNQFVFDNDKFDGIIKKIKPQVDYLKVNGQIPDDLVVVKYENLYSDLSRIEKLKQFDFGEMHWMNQSRKQLIEREELDKMISFEWKKAIYEQFKEDFETFNYSPPRDIIIDNISSQLVTSVLSRVIDEVKYKSYDTNEIEVELRQEKINYLRQLDVHIVSHGGVGSNYLIDYLENKNIRVLKRRNKMYTKNCHNSFKLVPETKTVYICGDLINSIISQHKRNFLNVNATKIQEMKEYQKYEDYPTLDYFLEKYPDDPIGIKKQYYNLKDSPNTVILKYPYTKESLKEAFGKLGFNLKFDDFKVKGRTTKFDISLLKNYPTNLQKIIQIYKDFKFE